MTFLYRHRKGLGLVLVVLVLLTLFGQLVKSHAAARPLRHGKREVCTFLGTPTYLAAKRLHPHWGPWRLYWAAHHCKVQTWTY